MKKIAKLVLKMMGLKFADLLGPLFLKSLKKAAVEQKLKDYVSKLSFIVPDISNQYTIAKIEGYMQRPNVEPSMPFK